MNDGTPGRTNDSGIDAPIKSLGTAFRIIDALKQNGGGGVTEIAAQTGLSKSAVHKHLTTLAAHGYVVKEGEQYRLGLQFLDLGGHVRDQFPSTTIIKTKVRELAVETGEVAQCMTEQNGKSFVLYREAGTNGVPSRTRPGTQMYLHQTASGKAILSQLPIERVDQIIDRHGLPRATEATITDRDELVEELESIRERGVAYSVGESTRGLYAVAAPMTKPDGTVLGAIVVSGPNHRMRGAPMDEEYPDLLLSLVNEIELNIAHS
jgi:DNA-binding IclR family transcriptional regulator